ATVSNRLSRSRRANPSRKPSVAAVSSHRTRASSSSSCAAQRGASVPRVPAGLGGDHVDGEAFLAGGEVPAYEPDDVGRLPAALPAAPHRPSAQRRTARPTASQPAGAAASADAAA
ncbi:hypothetical protein BLA24_01380, partial [Streptomyces cinnamoneus]